MYRYVTALLADKKPLRAGAGAKRARVRRSTLTRRRPGDMMEDDVKKLREFFVPLSREKTVQRELVRCGRGGGER